MGKMLNVLMIIFLAELGIGLFLTGCISGSGCEDQSSLFSWILNPQDWSASALVNLVQTNIFLIGGATAITVGTLWMKSDFLVYSGITATLFSFGQSLYRLWQSIANIGFLGNAIGSTVATISMGILFVYVFVTMIDFARGRD